MIVITFINLGTNMVSCMNLQSMSLTFGSNGAIFDNLNPIPKVKDEDFTSIKKWAFNQLGENDKKVFLYSFKIVVESKFCNSSENPKGLEDAAFRCRGNVNGLAVEAFCKNCNLYFPLIISTLEYFFLPSDTSHMLITCLRCKMPNSMVIPRYHGRENPLLADFQ